MGKMACSVRSEFCSKGEKYGLGNALFSDKRASMHKKPIYWTCSESSDALVDAFQSQAKRMTAAGFPVEVAACGTGWRFSSTEFGTFELAAQQTHGVIDPAESDALGTLLLFGARGHCPTALLIAGPDGVQFSHAQRLQAAKDRIASSSAYDTDLLLLVCGLMTTSMITERLRENIADPTFTPPFVRF
ncbi:MAG: hypothetical protein QMB52_01035 [Propionivibrio sp.]